MKKFLLILALFSIFYSSNAQNLSENKRVRISDFMIQWGFENNKNISLGLDDYRLLAPGSSLLANNLNDYTFSGGYSQGNGVLSGSIGLSFLNQENGRYKANPIVRIGFVYSRVSPAYASLSNESKYRYDTLVSSATGNEYYVDSVFMSNYSMNYSAEHLGLNASIQFSTDNEKRVSLFAGVGLSALFSFNARTLISKNEYSYLSTEENIYYSYPNGIFNNYAYEDESFPNKTATGFSASLPMGISVRLGKQNPFWKQIHLVYEIKPGIGSVIIPELKSYVSTSMSNTLGVKVSW